MTQPLTTPAEEPTSLLDWATGLATDPAARSRLADQRDTVLAAQGLSDVPPADLHHTLPLVTDSVAARLGTEVDGSAAATEAQRTGESPLDALTRQVLTATAVASVAAAYTGPDAPDAAAREDPDLDDLDPTPDPVTPLETMIMTPFAGDTDLDDFGTTAANTGGDDHAALLGQIDAFFDSAEAHGMNRPATAEEFLAEYGPDAMHRFLASFEPGDRAGDDYMNYANDMLTASRIAPTPTEPAAGDTDLDGFGGSATGDSTTDAGAAIPGWMSWDESTHQWVDNGRTDADLAAQDSSGSGDVASAHTGDGTTPSWMSWDESQGLWVDNGLRDDVEDLDGFGAGDAAGGTATDAPGTPQGWHSLNLEAQSHGYADAQAYLADTPRESLQGLAWEPGNRNAAYGELQAYIDAADASGMSPADYGAAHAYTPEQIDAAYAAHDAGSSDPGSDLDDFGGGTTAPAQDAYVPHGDDPFMDMVHSQGGGDGFGAGSGTTPTAQAGDDLDGFGSGTDTAPAAEAYTPHGDDPFADSYSASSDDAYAESSSDDSGSSDSYDSGSSDTGSDDGSSDDAGSDDGGSDGGGSDGGGESFG